MLRVRIARLCGVLIFGFVVHAVCLAAAAPASIRFDATSKVFRLDAAGMTYAFGINDQDELQTIYWGAAIASGDHMAAAVQNAGVASFDLPVSTTPQEYAGWGAGLYVEPALKVTFADGNRDLVLHYVSHTIRDNELTITLKDIERDLFVDVRYSIDPETVSYTHLTLPTIYS